MKDLISKIWYCYIWGLHDWTTLADQGKLDPLPANPNKEQALKHFLDMTKMYCVRCEKESEYSVEFKNEIINDIKNS